MSITTTFNFTIPGDYTYGPEIVVAGGFAELVDHSPVIPPDTAYTLENPTIKFNATILTDGLISISPTINITGNDEIRYSVEIDGKQFYFGLCGWIETDYTYEQTNTLEEINENLATLDIHNGANISIVMWLHSEDGSTTPQISNIDVETSFYVPPYAEPNFCIVYGYLYDAGNNPLKNAHVSAKVTDSDFDNTENIYFVNTAVQTKTNDNGYFEIKLIWSTQFRGVDQTYDFTIRPDGSNESISRNALTVPDLPTEEFDNLV